MKEGKLTSNTNQNQIKFLPELHSVVAVLQDLLESLGFNLGHFVRSVDPLLPVNNARFNKVHQLQNRKCNPTERKGDREGYLENDETI